MSEVKYPAAGDGMLAEAKHKALSRVYKFILSLPDRQEKRNEPADDLGRTTAGSENETSAITTDGTISIHPSTEGNKGGSNEFYHD